MKRRRVLVTLVIMVLLEVLEGLYYGQQINRGVFGWAA